MTTKKKINSTAKTESRVKTNITAKQAIDSKTHMTYAPSHTPRTYGYCRVSTRDQNEARLIDAMNVFGVDRIFLDKQSGKDFDRPAYKELLSLLSPGDVLVIMSIDRLGRNYDEIIEQWRYITKMINASIVVLDMPLLDTRNTRDLTGTLIADIVLQLLSYVAETERNFIKARQAEGIAAAKARGKVFGRPRIPKTEEYFNCIEQYKAGVISAREGARRLDVHHSTFLRWVKEESSTCQGMA